jgi:hypothetical protein
MNDSRSQPESPHAALRQRWLAHAAAAFDLMFDPRYQDQLVTFDQREQRAAEPSRDLTAWLLQQHVDTDPQARPDQSQRIVCPKCGRSGRRVTGPGEPLPQRQRTTLAGEGAFSRLGLVRAVAAPGVDGSCQPVVGGFTGRLRQAGATATGVLG